MLLISKTIFTGNWRHVTDIAKEMKKDFGVGAVKFLSDTLKTMNREGFNYRVDYSKNELTFNFTSEKAGLSKRSSVILIQMHAKRLMPDFKFLLKENENGFTISFVKREEIENHSKIELKNSETKPKKTGGYILASAIESMNRSTQLRNEIIKNGGRVPEKFKSTGEYNVYNFPSRETMIEKLGDLYSNQAYLQEKFYPKIFSAAERKLNKSQLNDLIQNSFYEYAMNLPKSALITQTMLMPQIIDALVDDPDMATYLKAEFKKSIETLPF